MPNVLLEKLLVQLTRIASVISEVILMDYQMKVFLVLEEPLSPGEIRGELLEEFA